MIISITHLVLFSIASAVIMSAAGMLVQLSGFTKLDMGTHLGCLLTGQKSGKKSLLFSLMAHFFAAIVIGYLYLQAIALFKLSLSLKTAIILGLGNTLFSGIFVKAFDILNPCVDSKSLQGIGFFASGYGVHGIISYTLLHIVFAVSFLLFLGAPVQF